MTSLLGLDPGVYQPHALHSPERIFPETNCYTDLWIELVHALGDQPLAMLGCCAVVDWEGDQWTFFKPAFSDLERLYGLETYELALYRSLPDHIAGQLDLGRFVIVEVDGYFLPDTAGRSYGESHEKTSIVVESIDHSKRSLRYFHNAGFWELDDDDYAGVLRLDGRPAVDLPPYAELVRRDRLPACPPDRLRDEARAAFASHLGRRPDRNPVLAFGEHLVAELPRLSGQEEYHAYAFATLRQCGAAWDAASAFLAWLDGSTNPLPAAQGFARLAAASKTMLLKLARAAATGHTLDPSEPIGEMARVWDETLDRLEA